MLFKNWIQTQTWKYFYGLQDVDTKAEYFHKLLFSKVEEYFPKKIFRVAKDDKPWVTHDVKLLDRQRKREFLKNHKSIKWYNLNEKYLNLIKKCKCAYAEKIVGDLKSSNPSQWYSKVKRMSNLTRDFDEQYFIEELSELDAQKQADTFVEYYAKTRNQFEPVKEDDFSDVLHSEARKM